MIEASRGATTRQYLDQASHRVCAGSSVKAHYTENHSDIELLRWIQSRVVRGKSLLLLEKIVLHVLGGGILWCGHYAAQLPHLGD